MWNKSGILVCEYVFNFPWLLQVTAPTRVAKVQGRSDKTDCGEGTGEWRWREGNG